MRLIWLLAVLAAGCARYEYGIVEPADLAARIGHKEPGEVKIALDSVQYRFRAVEDRLVLLAVNASDQPLELLGERSYLVDPARESRPLQARTIASHSYMKMILPPLRPVYRAAPWLGVRVGSDPYDALDDPAWAYPSSSAPYDGAAAGYWEWRGEGNVRLRLAYRRGEQTFHHDFVLSKKKMQ